MGEQNILSFLSLISASLTAQTAKVLVFIWASESHLKIVTVK